jgi:hypothetical protein
MVTTIQGLSKYSDAFGIPHEISIPFLRDVEKWKEASGEEWTVSRLKAIKLDFIRIKAGLDPCSVFVRRDGTRFYGSIGGLQRWCNSKKRWSQTIRFLQVYTSFVSSSVTPSQEFKFLSGVNSPEYKLPSSWDHLISRAVKELGIKGNILPDPRPLTFYPISSVKNVPTIYGRSEPESDYLFSQVSFLTDTHFGISMFQKYPNLFRPVVKGIEVDRTPRNWSAPTQTNKPFYTIVEGTVGRIGLIQEPGYKLRAVANPSRVYQAALQPLGDCLYNILKELPWDCTYNQLKPKEAIISHLRSGSTVHSVDLTGATDYFPLDFQLRLLKELVIDQSHVNLFKDLSRGRWHYGDTTISWSKGQPLGLYPSFASFALAHGLLLFILNNFKHGNAFFVLGDDVVILDDQLHSLYIQTLNEFGCPISDSKSVSSSLLAEFGGKLYTVDGITHQFKWRVISDNSFLDFVRNTGEGALALLRPMQRKIAKVLWSVPDFLGGLGFNPKGIPLEERIASFLIEYPQKKDTSFVMSYNSLIQRQNQFCPKTGTSLTNYKIVESADLDKRSYSFIIQYLPEFLRWYEIMGTNLYSVTNGNISLQIKSSTSWKTTVQKLNKRLGL